MTLDRNAGGGDHHRAFRSAGGAPNDAPGDKARQTSARAQINSFMTALGAYKLDTGTYPTTEQDLQALRIKPENVNQWQGPYLPKDIPNDPWGHPYVYKYPGEHGDEPDVISLARMASPAEKH